MLLSDGAGAVALLRSCFRRSAAHRHAADYLRGLIADVERKNGWQLAERAGYCQPRGMQRVLDRYAWVVVDEATVAPAISRSSPGRPMARPISAPPLTSWGTSPPLPGDGAQGPRLYDWAYVPVRPALRAGWVHGLLVRRHPERADGDAARGAGAGGRGALEHRRHVQAGQGPGGAGPLRGAQLAGLASPHHAGPARLRRAHARRSAPDASKGGSNVACCPRHIPITVPEIRRLLVRLLWAATLPSQWHRRHQTIAQNCHRRRRLKRKREL